MCWIDVGKKASVFGSASHKGYYATDTGKKSLRPSPKLPAVDELFCLALLGIPLLSRFYKRASNGFKYLGPKLFWFVFCLFVCLFVCFSILHSASMAVVSTQVCVAMCFLQACSHYVSRDAAQCTGILSSRHLWSPPCAGFYLTACLADH